MGTSFARVGLLSFLAIASACGDDQATTDGGGVDGATPDVSASDSPSDVTSPGDSGGDGGAPKGKTAYGYVNFDEYPSTSLIYGVGALFVASVDGGAVSPPPPGPLYPCTMTVGSCCYSPAPPLDAGLVDAGPLVQLVHTSAGTITVADKTTVLGALSWQDAGAYTSLSSFTKPSVKWADGDLLHASAAGDFVHAFDGGVTAATLPAGFNVTLSQKSPGTTISKSKNFTLSWTAVSGAMVLNLTGSSLAGITCMTATDTGSITIDQSLLAKLTDTHGQLGLSRTTTTDVSPDNANVTINSSASVSGYATFSP